MTKCSNEQVARPDGCTTLLGSAADQLAEAVFRLQALSEAGGDGGGPARLAVAASELSSALTDGLLRLSGSAAATGELQVVARSPIHPQ